MNDKLIFYALLNASLISILLLIVYFFPLPLHGVYPHTIEGLWGIITAPLLHASIEHLFNNLFSLFILLFILFLHFSPVSWQILLISYLLPGFFTWFLGREAYHVGSSGMVYALTTYIFFTGFLVANYSLVALSFLVIFLHTGFLWGMFPLQQDISWETHLGGFITGLLSSVLFLKKIKNYYPEPIDDEKEKEKENNLENFEEHEKDPEN